MTINAYQTDTVQLSEHFTSGEFRCKCGKQHDILIADDLITKLEKLYAALNCSKIVVTSGHRCEAHDKAVGGSGKGQHIKGTAADICCYGQDGQPISSKIVCCKAQDIGFTGIANITRGYIYTHVDVRTGSKWYGDEVHGNHTVTGDFYQYFGMNQGGGAAVPEGLIRKGDRGDAVTWLQTKLSERGYLRASEVDGIFGKITLGAVLAFQFENGLQVDGVCGGETKARLTE